MLGNVNPTLSLNTRARKIFTPTEMSPLRSYGVTWRIRRLRRAAFIIVLTDSFVDLKITRNGRFRSRIRWPRGRLENKTNVSYRSMTTTKVRVGNQLENVASFVTFSFYFSRTTITAPARRPIYRFFFGLVYNTRTYIAFVVSQYTSPPVYWTSSVIVLRQNFG